MAIRTPLSEEIGIEIPFMQAGMGGIGPITLARLAAAISEAGALGTIAQPALVLEEPGISGDELDEQIQKVVGQVREGTADHLRLVGCEVSVAQCLTHAVPLRVEGAGQPLPTACVAPVESIPRSRSGRAEKEPDRSSFQASRRTTSRRELQSMPTLQPNQPVIRSDPQLTVVR